MTNPEGPPEPGDDPDRYWRRPAEGGPVASPAPPPGPAPEPYRGPPPTTAPPAHWRPPVLVPPEPPRQMPLQDHARLDAEEASARTISHGIGLVTAAVLLILLIAMCARLVS